jgi:hypothetical protein
MISMQRKSLVAIVAFALCGALLAGVWRALPDPAAWRPTDGYLIQEAYRLGPAVAAATFPGWQPETVPVLVTNGRANYLVSPWPGAPAGHPVRADGLSVTLLSRLVVPVIANAAIPVNDRVVALVTGKEVLEQALGGMVAELGMAGGSETALLRGLLQAGSGRRITPEEYVTVILHESFHTYQLPVIERWWRRLGDDDESQQELWATVYTDEQNNQLQNEEGRALLAAALAPDDATARAAVRTFLQARDDRADYWQGKLGAGKAGLLLEWERLYEWQEGLASYVQMEAYRVAVATGHSALPEVAGMPGYSGYRGGADSGRSRLISAIGAPVASAAPRERVGRLGAGQALALDRLLTGWKVRAAVGTALTDLLREAVSEPQE